MLHKVVELWLKEKRSDWDIDSWWGGGKVDSSCGFGAFYAWLLVVVFVLELKKKEEKSMFWLKRNEFLLFMSIKASSWSRLVGKKSASSKKNESFDWNNGSHETL